MFKMHLFFHQIVPLKLAIKVNAKSAVTCIRIDLSSRKQCKAELNKRTDGEQNLQRRVGFFQIYHPLVQTDLAVLRFIVRFETG